MPGPMIPLAPRQAMAEQSALLSTSQSVDLEAPSLSQDSAAGPSKAEWTATRAQMASTATTITTIQHAVMAQQQHAPAGQAPMAQHHHAPAGTSQCDAPSTAPAHRANTAWGAQGDPARPQQSSHRARVAPSDPVPPCQEEEASLHSSSLLWACRFRVRGGPVSGGLRGGGGPCTQGLPRSAVCPRTLPKPFPKGHEHPGAAWGAP